MVGYIRTDETPHVEYLRTALSELRACTLRGTRRRGSRRRRGGRRAARPHAARAHRRAPAPAARRTRAARAACASRCGGLRSRFDALQEQFDAARRRWTPPAVHRRRAYAAVRRSADREHCHAALSVRAASCASPPRYGELQGSRAGRLARAGRPGRPHARARRSTRGASAIVAAPSRCGGLLIKMCQVIGTRSDVFPAEYVQVLSQCHDRSPPRPFEEIRAKVERELGGPLGATLRRVRAAADRRRVAGAGASRAPPQRPRGGGQGAVPGHRSDRPRRLREPDVASAASTSASIATRSISCRCSRS